MSRFYLYLRLPVLYGCDYTDISVLCSIKLVLISVNLVITKRLKLAMWFFFPTDTFIHVLLLTVQTNTDMFQLYKRFCIDIVLLCIHFWFLNFDDF